MEKREYLELEYRKVLKILNEFNSAIDEASGVMLKVYTFEEDPKICGINIKYDKGKKELTSSVLLSLIKACFYLQGKAAVTFTMHENTCTVTVVLDTDSLDALGVMRSNLQRASGNTETDSKIAITNFIYTITHLTNKYINFDGRL